MKTNHLQLQSFFEIWFTTLHTDNISLKDDGALQYFYLHSLHGCPQEAPEHQMMKDHLILGAKKINISFLCKC